MTTTTQQLDQATADTDKAHTVRDAAIYKLMQAQLAVVLAEGICSDCGGDEMFLKAMNERDEAIHVLVDAEFAFCDALEVWGALEQPENKAAH